MEEKDNEEPQTIEVEKLFHEILVADSTEKKYYLSIVACIVAEEDDDESCELNVDEVDADNLISKFCDTELAKVWHKFDTTKQVGILYGLLCLLPCSSIATKVTQAAREALRRVLLLDIRRASSPYANYSIPVFTLIKGFGEAQIEFQNAINEWYKWEVPLKLDALIEGINILFSLMDEEQDAIAEGANRLMAYFVLYNEIQCVSLLTYIIDKLGQQDGHLWQWLQSSVQHLHTCKGESCEMDMMLTQESVAVTEFNLYIPTNKLIVCAVLLRLSLLGTKHGAEVNSVILYIERSDRGARTWGERASLMDRLLLLLEEHQNIQGKEAILKCLFHVSQNMMDMGGVVVQCPDEVLKKMAIYFADGLSLDMKIWSGKCLISFLNGHLYDVSLYIYNELRSILHLLNPARLHVGGLDFGDHSKVSA